MKLSIRTKLLIGFILLLGLSYFIQSIIFSRVSTYIEEQVSDSLKMRALDASSDVTDLFSSIDKNAASIANYYSGIEKIDDPIFISLVKYISDNNTFISKITILSTTGRELFRYDQKGITPSANLSIELPSSEFSSALSGEKTHSKVYYLGAVSSPYVDVFFPLSKSGKVDDTAVIKMQINLEQLWSVIAGIKLGENGFAYIVDDNGILIAHPDKVFLNTRPNVSLRMTRPTITETNKYVFEQEEARYENEKNIGVIARIVRVPSMDWYIVFEQPEEEAYRFLFFVRGLFFFVVGGSLFLLFFIAFFLSNNLTRAIFQLKKGTRLVMQGDLNTRINVQTGDELQDLADSFNSMTQKLQHAIGNLEQEKNLLSAERNKLAVALSGIADGVIAIDLNRRIIVFNKAAETITGYEFSEAAGRTVDQIIQLKQEDTPLEMTTYAPIRTDGYEGTVFLADDLILIGKQEKKITVKLTAGQIKEGANVNLGCILILHDISRERELEDMKLDFVSMAAHELRTPLTSIRGYLSVFMSEFQERLNGEQNMFLQRIFIASEQLMSLIENLLNVTRIEKGVMALTIEPIDWFSFVKTTLEPLNDRAKEKNISVIIESPEETLPKVNVDKFRIAEVVTNLLQNAINYTPVGGNVKIFFEKQDDAIVTNISDNGYGIPKEALPKLFTKFFRVSGKLEQGSKGTGLGLYISKEIVEMHRGKIWVNSEIDKGSTFSFSLPTKKEENK